MRAELLANVERDRLNTARLRDRDWVVLRFWEHQPVDEVVRVVVAVVSSA